jgi:hypothetical protein
LRRQWWWRGGLQGWYTKAVLGQQWQCRDSNCGIKSVATALPVTRRVGTVAEVSE